MLLSPSGSAVLTPAGSRSGCGQAVAKTVILLRNEHLGAHAFERQPKYVGKPADRHIAGTNRGAALALASTISLR